MANFLVVRVTDAAGAPLDATVELAVNRAPLEMRPSPGAGRGVLEARLPPQATMLHLAARRPGLHDVDQDLRFAATPEAPTVTVVEPWHTGLVGIALASRGAADRSVDIHLALGELRDALTPVLKVATRPPKTPPQPALSFPPRGKPELELVERESIVAPEPPAGATGARLLRHAVQQVSGGGRVLFAQRSVAPRLVAAWVPPALNLVAAGVGALPFHLHFPADAGAADGEPAGVGWRSVSALHRALYGGTRLAGQHEAARRTAILVLPSGGPLGDLATERGLHALLRELAHWLVRVGRPRVPAKRVGAVAASASGAGAAHLERLLASARDGAAADPELARRLEEVYVLGGAAEAAPGLPAEVERWLDACPAGARRRARVYDHALAPWEGLRRRLAGREVARRLEDCETFESEGERGTLVVIPRPLARRIEARPERSVDDVIPALFAYHALARSGFPEVRG